MKNLTEKLKEALVPLYKELSVIAQPADSAFCVQWGRNYPIKPNEGILFVGKAVNGWKEFDEIDVLFGNGATRIFNEDDQMQWVENQEGGPNGLYNTSKSAFWRVIKKISQMSYPDNWSSYVA